MLCDPEELSDFKPNEITPSKHRGYLGSACLSGYASTSLTAKADKHQESPFATALKVCDDV